MYRYRQKEMYERYCRWLNKGTFTIEVAAFEYMKRNPYFISVASLYNLDFGSRNSTEILKIKQLLQQIFLYTGFDIENIKQQYGCTLVERYKNLNFTSFNGIFGEYRHKGENYYYSDIYKVNRHHYLEKKEDRLIKESPSALNAKKDHPVDLNYFYNRGIGLRWLPHVVPSMYIKINPSIKKDDLKLALTNLIKQIDKDDAIPSTQWKLSEYAAPEICLDASDNTNINLMAPTFQPLKSLVALIMYDFMYIYQIQDPGEIQKEIRSAFPKIPTSIIEEFDKYFNPGGKATNYQGVKFNFQHKKNNMDNVRSRIYGKYLDYIYPYKSKRLHQKLLLKEYRKIYSKEAVLKNKRIIMDTKNILAQYSPDILENYMGIIQLDCFTEKEYTTWSEDMFSLLKDVKYSDAIYDILLL